jgi:hypothetical protein
MEKETIEEAAKRIYPDDGYKDEMWCDLGMLYRDKFIEGAKWMQERMYSEEEVKTIASKLFYSMTDSDFGIKHTYESFEKWFEQNIKNN